MLKLIIEDDEGRKTVVPFVRDEITIGRQEGNTIRLTERNVSRRHARLLRSNGSVVVEDLGSYNGIRLNGEKVSGRANVADGDLIQIGDYDLAIQHEDQVGHPAHTPPPPPDVTPSPHAAQRANGTGAHPREEDPTETSAPAYEEAEPISDETAIPSAPPARPRPAAPAAAPTPASNAGAADNADSRRQATSIIRVDQIEAQRNRSVTDLDPEDAPRLVVLNTEFAGREFACIRTELRIGRTDDNDINLDHRSLSRTHAKLVREENGEWRVIDMQSANGLMVNGEPYAQATLSHLDTLELGHLKMKFVGAGESYTYVPGKEDQPGAPAAGGKSKTPLIIGGAAVVAVIAAVGVFVAVGSAGGKDDPTVTVTPPVTRTDPVAKKTPDPQPVKTAVKTPDVAPKPDPAQVAAEAAKKAIEAAATSLDEQDLEAAVATLEGAKKIPNIDQASMTMVEDLLDKAKGETLMRERLETAEKALDAGKYEQAKKLLDDAAATEMFADRHQALSDTLAAKLDAEEKKQAAVAAAARAERTPDRTPDRNPDRTAEKKDPPKQNDDAAESKRLFEEGKRLLSARQVREAKVALAKCVDVNPRFAKCHLLLGAAYAKLNESDAGAKHYEIFLKLAPDAPEAPRVRMMLEQYKGLKK